MIQKVFKDEILSKIQFLIGRRSSKIAERVWRTILSLDGRCRQQQRATCAGSHEFRTLVKCRMIADKIGIDNMAVHNIITKNFGMQKISIAFQLYTQPHLLEDHQLPDDKWHRDDSTTPF